ncbi:MAG: hypothetical protein WC825_06025 [Gallionellaceae bacterium]
MWHSSVSSLEKGLEERCSRANPEMGLEMAYQFSYLLSAVASMIEGNTFAKKDAREELKKIIGRGRCLLNARDEQAKAERIQARLLLTKSDGGAP